MEERLAYVSLEKANSHHKSEMIVGNLRFLNKMRKQRDLVVGGAPYHDIPYAFEYPVLD